MSSRQEMIESLEWNSGGYGFGVCSVANSMCWVMDSPGPEKPDLKSIVAVGSPSSKYTNEELEKLVKFSEEATARYDEMFTYRRGANLILFDKFENGSWLRKRLSWEFGPILSKTLDEAIEFMTEQ